MVDAPVVTETTALGAAMLAALQCGVYRSLDELRENWQCGRSFQTLPWIRQSPVVLYRGWQKAPQRSQTHFGSTWRVYRQGSIYAYGSFTLGTVHYREAGAGAPLVLLHANPGDSRDF